MAKERTVINQELCKKVKLMLAGGANGKEVAELLGIGETTVSRIKKAGFDIVKYNENTDMRRNRKNEEKVPEPEQMKVELIYDQSIAEEYRKEQEQKNDENRMMRFQAHQVDRIIGRMEGAIQKLMENNMGAAYLITQKLDRLNDTLCQILRSIGSEKA